MVKTNSRRDGFVSTLASGVDGKSLHNEILLDLPRKECAVVFPHLKLIPMPTHAVLNEMGEPIQHAYFINSGLASVLNVLSDGKSVEVGLTGKEGFVGLPVVAGLNTSASRVVMQIAGSAYKISAANLIKSLRECPTLEKSLHQFTHLMGMQGSHVAACNRVHNVEERLARWLLMSQDRIQSDYVPLTQEFLAHMLGTRRASVTVAAGILQKAGLITYTRGAVRIIDRTQLEDSSCECYSTMVQQSKNWENESQ